MKRKHYPTKRAQYHAFIKRQYAIAIEKLKRECASEIANELVKMFFGENHIAGQPPSVWVGGVVATGSHSIVGSGSPEHMLYGGIPYVNARSAVTIQTDSRLK